MSTSLQGKTSDENFVILFIIMEFVDTSGPQMYIIYFVRVPHECQLHCKVINYYILLYCLLLWSLWIQVIRVQM